MSVQEMKQSLMDAIQAIQDEVDAADKKRKKAVAEANKIYQRYHQDYKERKQKIDERVMSLQAQLQDAQGKAKAAAVSATIADDDTAFRAAQQEVESASSKITALTVMIEQMQNRAIPRNEELFNECKCAAEKEGNAYSDYRTLCRELYAVAEDADDSLRRVKDRLSGILEYSNRRSGFDRVEAHYYEAHEKADTTPKTEAHPPIRRQSLSGAWTEVWDADAGKYVVDQMGH